MNTTAMRWYLTKIRPMRFLAAATAALLLALSFGVQAQFPQQHPNIAQKAQTGARPGMTPTPACGCPATVDFRLRMLPGQTEMSTPLSTLLGYARGRFVALTQNGCEYAYQQAQSGAPNTPIGEININDRGQTALNCPDMKTFSFTVDATSCTVPSPTQPPPAALSYDVKPPLLPAGQTGPYTCTAAMSCGFPSGQYITLANVQRVRASNGFCTYSVQSGNVDNRDNNTRAAVRFSQGPLVNR